MKKGIVIAIWVLILFSLSVIGYSQEKQSPRIKELTTKIQGLVNRRNMLNDEVVRVGQEILRTEGMIRERRKIEAEEVSE